MQVIAIWHSLVSVHIPQGVGSWRQWANILLTSATRIVATRARLARATASGVNPGTIKTSSGESVRANVVCVWTSGCDVQFS